MTSKQLKLIAAALAVLLLLWGGSALLSRGSDTITGSLAVPALVEADVDTITIVKATDSIVLVDRKSTRLNSSHGYNSYAVFCLKKKKEIDIGVPLVLCVHS